MITKFINSVYFNIILSMLAAFFIIMQEVWIGTAMVLLNSIVLGVCAAIGFAWIAEAVKCVVYHAPFIRKNILVGSIFGIVVAIIVAILTV